MSIYLGLFLKNYMNLESKFSRFSWWASLLPISGLYEWYMLKLQLAQSQIMFGSNIMKKRGPSMGVLCYQRGLKRATP